MNESLKPTDNPAADAARGSSQFYRAIIIAGIFFVLALGAALLLVKWKGKQLIPGSSNPHPTSRLSVPVHAFLA